MSFKLGQLTIAPALPSLDDKAEQLIDKSEQLIDKYRTRADTREAVETKDYPTRRVDVIVGVILCISSAAVMIGGIYVMTNMLFF